MSDAREALVALILEQFRAAETYMDLPRQAGLLGDAILAAGWTPPGERVKASVEALSDALAGEGIDALPGEPDLTAMAERLIGLFPGRTEAEVKAEVLRDAADDVVAEEFLRALPPAEYGENAVESAAAWLRRRAASLARGEGS